MRLALAALVFVGCGSSPAATEQAIARLDLPRLDESARVMLLTKASPSAVVWIAGNGGLVVDEWQGTLEAPREAEPDDVRRAVLEVASLRGGSNVDAVLARMKTIDEIDRNLVDARQSLVGRTPMDDHAVPAAGRLASSAGVPLAKLDRLAPLVIATPSAPASKLARVLQQTGGAVAVDHLGKLAVLDVAFEPERAAELPGTGLWLEVWADASGMHLTVQPEDRDVVVPYAGLHFDRDALAVAWRKLDLTRARVDILARSDTTVQTVIDLVAALSAIDITNLALAVGPDSMTARTEQIRAAKGDGVFGQPTAIAGMPSAQGDLDKPTIRFTVMQHMTDIRACYLRELVANPSLAGTVATQFFITPQGTVASASAAGVHTGVANCVAEVIRTIKFPKPDGGGGVQVNYPFTFRPGP